MYIIMYFLDNFFTKVWVLYIRNMISFAWLKNRSWFSSLLSTAKTIRVGMYKNNFAKFSHWIFERKQFYILLELSRSHLPQLPNVRVYNKIISNRLSHQWSCAIYCTWCWSIWVCENSKMKSKSLNDSHRNFLRVSGDPQQWKVKWTSHLKFSTHHH